MIYGIIRIHPESCYKYSSLSELKLVLRQTDVGHITSKIQIQEANPVSLIFWFGNGIGGYVPIPFDIPTQC